MTPDPHRGDGDRCLWQHQCSVRLLRLSQNAFAVTNLGDSADANVGDCLSPRRTLVGTLRAALRRLTPARDHAIGFLVAGVIVPTSLPALTDPAGLWIDGTIAGRPCQHFFAFSSPIDVAHDHAERKTTNRLTD
ncbi:MAG: hypothetical protein IPM84_25930 [Anaerolineae bacterium]|nr:hypothetical protein [Anaerolineae bacterium]